MPVYFVMRDRRGVGLEGKGGGEELVGIEEGETINQYILYGKLSIVNRRKKFLLPR